MNKKWLTELINDYETLGITIEPSLKKAAIFLEYQIWLQWLEENTLDRNAQIILSRLGEVANGEVEKIL